MEAAVSCGRCTSPKSSRHGGCTMRRDTRPACRGTHSLVQVAAHALRGASPLLEQARPLLEQVAPFAHAVADTLDPHSAAAEDVGALRHRRPDGDGAPPG